jgi:hypothetical protein
VARLLRAAAVATNSPPDDEKKKSQDELPFVDELGVEDIYEPIAGGRGRLFSTAGRNAPIAEFTNEFLVMHPPQMPFQEADQSETVTVVGDQYGILLDEFGYQKKMIGARYHGHVIFWLAQLNPGTTRHLVAWFDEDNVAHRLILNNEFVTTDMAYRLRNRTHDGELTIFPELQSE